MGGNLAERDPLATARSPS